MRKQNNTPHTAMRFDMGKETETDPKERYYREKAQTLFAEIMLRGIIRAQREGEEKNAENGKEAKSL